MSTEPWDSECVPAYWIKIKAHSVNTKALKEIDSEAQWASFWKASEEERDRQMIQDIDRQWKVDEERESETACKCVAHTEGVSTEWDTSWLISWQNGTPGVLYHKTFVIHIRIFNFACTTAVILF